MRSVLLIILSVSTQLTWAQSTFDAGEGDLTVGLPAPNRPRGDGQAPAPKRETQPAAPAVDPSFPQCSNRPSIQASTGSVALATRMFSSILGISNPLRKRLVHENRDQDNSFQLFRVGNDTLYARVVSTDNGNHDLPAYVCQRGDKVEAIIDAGAWGKFPVVVSKINSSAVHITGNKSGRFDAIPAQEITGSTR